MGMLENMRTIITGGASGIGEQAVRLSLASDLDSYLTGQEIAVDSGVTAWNGQPRLTRIIGDVTIP